MSPILVRPVREQLEHDRVIRLLQVKLKRKHDVTANIGEDQSTAVKIGQMQIFPDLVLTSTDRGRKLMGTVEVETSESVNHLEARAQWAHLGRARAPFHLYVPAGSVDIARRLAAENHVNVSEIWTLSHDRRPDAVHACSSVGAGDEAPGGRATGGARRGASTGRACRGRWSAARPARPAKKRPAVPPKKRDAAPVAPPARGAPGARNASARKRVASSKSAPTQKRK